MPIGIPLPDLGRRLPVVSQSSSLCVLNPMIVILDSSPLRYASSSSPGRGANGNTGSQVDIPTSSSGLFVRASRASVPGTDGINVSRRGDIHSDVFGSTPSRRRRLFVDDNGVPVRDRAPESDARTFSNLDPNTSEANDIEIGRAHV